MDHNITFELARAVFDDPNALIEPDDEPGEVRWRQIGMAAGRILLVVFIDRVVDDNPMLDESLRRIRINSARKASKHEHERSFRQAV